MTPDQPDHKQQIVLLSTFSGLLLGSLFFGLCGGVFTDVMGREQVDTSIEVFGGTVGRFAFLQGLMCCGGCGGIGGGLLGNLIGKAFVQPKKDE
jgi:hypothetical protein